jgi:hypothetical protein
MDMIGKALLVLPYLIRLNLKSEIEKAEKEIADLSNQQLERPNVDYVGIMSNKVSYIEGLKKAIEIVREEIKDVADYV